MPEIFLPKTLASYNKHQLYRFMDWANDNELTQMAGENGEGFVSAFDKVLEMSQVDEKGKPMTEKGRKRLKLALSTLAAIVDQNIDLATLKGEILVWSTPDPGIFRLEHSIYRRRIF